MCGVCELGYTRFSSTSKCQVCPDNVGLGVFWSLFCAVLAALCIWGVLRISRGSQKGFIRPILNAWQTMSVVLMTGKDWPPAVQFIQVYVLQAVNLDIFSLASPACMSMPMNFYHRFTLTILGSVILVGSPWVWATKQYRKRQHEPEAWTQAKSARLNDSMLLTFMLYTLVTAQAFNFFRCKGVPSMDGDKLAETFYLVPDMSLECRDGSWIGVLFLVLPVLILFSLGVPIGMAVLLWRRRDRLEDEDVLNVYGMIYLPFKPQFYYFESITMLFKLLLLGALVFFDDGSQFQHAAMLLISATQLLVHARLQPYNTRTKNALQYIGTGVTFAVSLGGMLTAYMQVSKEEASFRLFGQERNETRKEYDGQIAIVQGGLDAAIFLAILPTSAYLVYKQWVKRHAHAEGAVKMWGKTARLRRSIGSLFGKGGGTKRRQTIEWSHGAQRRNPLDAPPPPPRSASVGGAPTTAFDLAVPSESKLRCPESGLAMKSAKEGHTNAEAENWTSSQQQAALSSLVGSASSNTSTDGEVKQISASTEEGSEEGGETSSEDGDWASAGQQALSNHCPPRGVDGGNASNRGNEEGEICIEMINRSGDGHGGDVVSQENVRGVDRLSVEI
jgi:hypothetical protein